jgi:hypothetical protein
MPTWLLIPIVVAVAVLVLALVWWSSGRARPLVRGHEGRINDAPAEQSATSRTTDVTRLVLPQDLPHERNEPPR